MSRPAGAVANSARAVRKMIGIPSCVVLEQLLGDAPAVEPGHHHVEQDHVGPLVRAFSTPDGPSAASITSIPPPRGSPGRAADRRLVVDHEHLGHPGRRVYTRRRST
jgi:hypothetical protein